MQFDPWRFVVSRHHHAIVEVVKQKRCPCREFCIGSDSEGGDEEEMVADADCAAGGGRAAKFCVRPEFVLSLVLLFEQAAELKGSSVYAASSPQGPHEFMPKETVKFGESSVYAASCPQGRCEFMPETVKVEESSGYAGSS